MRVVASSLPEAAAFSFVVVQGDPGQASLRAAGELDLAAVEHLAAILTAQEAAGRTSIRIDLSAVTFMDCACLGVLVDAYHRLTAARGHLLLTNVSHAVLRLLVLAELTERLTACEPEPLVAGAPA